MGVYLVVQGLHYGGPDDPRLNRFCRVLCAAGFVVVAPFLSDYLALRVSAETVDETAAALDYANEIAAGLKLLPPAIFSISFGSSPTLAVAASAKYRDRVSGIVLFGGYFDFLAMIRFAVSARAFHQGELLDVPYDPLNGPAVFVNLLPFIDAPGPREALTEAWLEMARRTWGRAALRPAERRTPIAQELAAALAPEQRHLFLIGCNLRPGGSSLVEAGLAKAGSFFAFTDPTPHLAALKAPVVIAHGRDDDVIPWTEAHKLEAGLAAGHPQRVLLTGMYGHTGSAIPSPSLLAGELRSMLAVVDAMIDAPLGLLMERGD